MEVNNMNCPNCNNPVSIADKKCKYCGGPITVTTFATAAGLTNLQLNKYVTSYRKTTAEQPNNVFARVSLGVCRLRLKFYDDAFADFRRALEEDFYNSDLHFYCAVCLMRGKKPFLQSRQTIDEVLTYLDAAISIENKGIYHYFAAYVKADYFERKKFQIADGSGETLARARGAGYSNTVKYLPAKVMTDEEYEALVDKRISEMDIKQFGLDQLGIDADEIKDIAPLICAYITSKRSRLILQQNT